MKRHVTQKLFWKQWPYKVLLKTRRESDEPALPRLHYRSYRDDIESSIATNRIRQWFKKHYPNGGVRRESGISLFVNTQEEADHIIDTWPKLVEAVWAPADDRALALLQSHTYDVVRARPWYGRFPIRARILYTVDFRNQGLPLLREAVNSLEKGSWFTAGLLRTLITDDNGRMQWACGQPVHLYLAENEDAIMLKLQAGDWIDRFERVRAP